MGIKKGDKCMRIKSITINLQCENAAFEDNGQQQEIYTILQKWLDEMSDRGLHDVNLKDSNGNTCGSVKVEGTSV